jgi:hypothetical protein
MLGQTLHAINFRILYDAKLDERLLLLLLLPFTRRA